MFFYSDTEEAEKSEAVEEQVADLQVAGGDIFYLYILNAKFTT